MDSPVTRSIRIALAQINPTVGDLAGNHGLIVDRIRRARDMGADLIVLPELALTGYPPEDLLLKPSFIAENLAHLREIVAETRDIAAVLGFVDHAGDVFNAAAFACAGQLCGVYHKVYLPNYGVFDEERYFRRGDSCPIFNLGGIRIGVSVCEDAWYPTGPLTIQAQSGAELLVNINGSPYHHGKREARERMIATRAMDNRAFVAWVNLVGGQDELVFDGNSLVFDPDGSVVARAPSFEEHLLLVDLDLGTVFGERLHDTRMRREAQGQTAFHLEVREVEIPVSPPLLRPPLPPMTPVSPLEGPDEVYRALVVGTADYVRKTGFGKVVVGLSGGVDSALTAAVAADALGPANVIGVAMPSRFTSRESLEDAADVARRLGIEHMEISIEPGHQAYESMLAGAFGANAAGLAEENVQPRIRGNILMALCNKFGYLLLTTGNKSELATGYCTLYGDMAGGFAVLKDIPKTLVYELCRFRNSSSPVIPERILAKPPTAELRENQLDTDSLPPYEVLDPILKGYVEDDRSLDDLIAAGHDAQTVARVINLVDRSEYKRRQAPPGVKITPRAFGRDRRMPIVNRYPAARRAEPADARAARPKPGPAPV